MGNDYWPNEIYTHRVIIEIEKLLHVIQKYLKFYFFLNNYKTATRLGVNIIRSYRKCFV